jgi:hypothetical protein
VTPPGAPAPLAVRWARNARVALARLKRWAWESKSPLRGAVARALKSLPFVRRLLLRRLARPDERKAA